LAADAIDRHVQEITLLGYTVVRGVVDSAGLPRWRDRIDAVIGRQVEEAGGVDRVKELDDANTARAILAYDRSFIDLVVHPAVLAICERLLGDYFILTHHNALSNPPDATGHYQMAYHRDLPFQHFVTSRPISLSALFCVDEFSGETGATVVLPGSHKVEPFPDDEVVGANERQVAAVAGSYIVMDSMLYHRAAANRSSRPRRAINHIYALPFLKQQIVLPSAIGGDFAGDPFLARLLGYESDPPRNVAEWRTRRARRLRIGDA